MSSEIHFLNSSGLVRLEDCLQEVELDVIREVYDEISKDPYFPTNCGIAAVALGEKGFSIQLGRFNTDYPDDLRLVPERNYRIHRWNRLGGIFIDQTAFQFNPFLYENLRLPEGIIIFDSHHTIARRYMSEAQFRRRMDL